MASFASAAQKPLATTTPYICNMFYLFLEEGMRARAAVHFNLCTASWALNAQTHYHYDVGVVVSFGSEACKRYVGC